MQFAAITVYCLTASICVRLASANLFPDNKARRRNAPVVLYAAVVDVATQIREFACSLRQAPPAWHFTSLQYDTNCSASDAPGVWPTSQARKSASPLAWVGAAS
ncbi:hypothetical protein K456DRAFT_1516179 [Colletotrichum gloeosporioides 23]|nr:hypothetical protein K456DRAFT_1516179 [Colletotrichum gloeosporioides 23]